ncbi:hypothetical protein B0H10DRAFT_2088241 [Mycena sp. CBHHK59/15]|nr:hypothetical protein B0H10DRAFT_2088241 [Mycena sp. CBHHK59/15]
MIILDNPNQQTSKLAVAASPALRLPEPVAGRSASLPDYETSQAQHSVIFRKPTFPQRFDSRFWRATFFALAIYVFLSVVIGIPVIVTRIAYRRGHPPPVHSLFFDEPSAAPLGLPNTGGMLMAESSTICDEWGSLEDDSAAGGYYTAAAYHNLSPSGLFSVRSNASDEIVAAHPAVGNLTVDINPDSSMTMAAFFITLTTSSVQLREQTHVCFAPSGDDRGLSIYIPQSLAENDMLSFDIRLLFPQTSHLLTVSNLITYLPMFQQSFGSLSSRIHFENINIAGASVEVVCDSLQANKIAIKNMFGPISGTFNVTQSLKLDNIGGSISTNVTLNNDPSSQNLPTFLSLDTGNSDIVADVTMVGPSSVRANSRPAKFIANVKTFNGPLSLNVGHDAATAPALLDLRVENNQAQSTVALDAKYAGVFDLHTKLAPAKVDYGQGIADPTGDAQQWHLDVDSNSTSSTRGWVGWGTRPQYWNPATDGKVLVVSSLSPILLQLGS